MSPKPALISMDGELMWIIEVRGLDLKNHGWEGNVFEFPADSALGSASESE